MAECEEMAGLLPGVAAGVACRDDRARVLRHVAECPDCRRDLHAATTVADELLALAPPHDPPAGFESTVLARIAQAPRRPPAGRGRTTSGS
jgi:anti-sigma factor ChrR (cupin superfamily)